LLAQVLRNAVRVLDRGRVDDAETAGKRTGERFLQRAQLLVVGGRAYDLVHEIRTVESAHDRLGERDAELRDDVFAHRGSGGCGEREDGRVSERRHDAAEIQICRAEVVSPLRDAVG